MDNYDEGYLRIDEEKFEEIYNLALERAKERNLICSANQVSFSYIRLRRVILRCAQSVASLRVFDEYIATPVSAFSR